MRMVLIGYLSHQHLAVGSHKCSPANHSQTSGVGSWFSGATRWLYNNKDTFQTGEYFFLNSKLMISSSWHHLSPHEFCSVAHTKNLFTFCYWKSGFPFHRHTQIYFELFQSNVTKCFAERNSNCVTQSSSVLKADSSSFLNPVRRCGTVSILRIKVIKAFCVIINDCKQHLI